MRDQLLFKWLNNAEISGIGDAMEVIEFSSGAKVVEVGNVVDYIYFVREGSVMVSDGDLHKTVREGGWFASGEEVVLDTLRSQEDSTRRMIQTFERNAMRGVASEDKGYQGIMFSETGEAVATTAIDMLRVHVSTLLELMQTLVYHNVPREATGGNHFVAILRNVPLFAELELENLEAICEAFTTRRYPPGAYVLLLLFYIPTPFQPSPSQ